MLTAQSSGRNQSVECLLLIQPYEGGEWNTEKIKHL